MSTLSVEYWRESLLRLSAVFEKEKGHLCRLDGNIGDGDHGTSMALGFSEIAERLSAGGSSDVGSLLQMAGNTFVNSVGGVTGIIFGTLLIEAGKKADAKTAICTGDLADMFDSALLGIQTAGKAKGGDKSVVDALAPAVKALKSASRQELCPAEALNLASTSAETGMKATRDMKASVGRARYQKEKAVGHIDPGAMSIAIIFRTLAELTENLDARDVSRQFLGGRTDAACESQ